MKWILILTIFTSRSPASGGPSDAAAIHSVAGFTTEIACKQAGDAFRKTWRNDNITGDEGEQAGTFRYTCVRQ